MGGWGPGKGQIWMKQCRLNHDPRHGPDPSAHINCADQSGLGLGCKKGVEFKNQHGNFYKVKSQVTIRAPAKNASIGTSLVGHVVQSPAA